ncbi:MAG: DinB family protein [Acidobacteria bacterium]|nr:DinB family protein [Acidobacteriota bacterium]
MLDALEDFRETVLTGAARLLKLTEEESERRTAEGKWSPKEIVGHLIDSAANNHQRFVRAQFTEDLLFPGYEQEEWVASQHYQQAAWPKLVKLWRAYNEHLHHVVSHVPEEQLTKPRARHSLQRIAWQTVSEHEPTTLEYLIRDYIAHLKHHLNQIFKD